MTHISVPRELLEEAASNCKASIVEEGISDSRRVYRSELHFRLRAELSALRAGSGEAVARMLTWIGKDTYPRKGYTISRTYDEWHKNAYPESWEEGAPLYTNPQPSAVPVVEKLVEALEAVEALIEHSYTGTREGMTYLQNTCDDAQDALTTGQQWIKENT